MELPIEEFQRMFDEATKCKTSGKISGYEVLEKYSDCVYNIRVLIDNNTYYTLNFSNNKKCSEENNKEILDLQYPKGKEIDVVVNAEQDYIFLADKNTDYIKYDANSIGRCTNNFIPKKLVSQQSQEASQPIEIKQDLNYMLFGIILFLVVIIGILSFKIYKGNDK